MKSRYANRTTALILSFMWLWNGAVYHLAFFSSINKAAFVFGSLFIIQGFLFLREGMLKNNLGFDFNRDVYSMTGGVFIIYSMVIYPVLGSIAGHGWPHSPAFGLAPCPTTIFTYGMLLLSSERVPKVLLIVPLLWALIGLSSASTFGIYEDFGLLLAGLSGTVIILVREIRDQRHVSLLARQNEPRKPVHSDIAWTTRR